MSRAGGGLDTGVTDAGVTRRLSPMQKMTIGKLRSGQEGKVPVTIAAEVRADGLLAVCAERRAENEQVTVTAVLAYLLARTLADHAALNAALVDDETMIQYADVNLGIAVALEDGSLVVPVVHAAQERDLDDLAAAVAELAGKARAKSLGLPDLRGGTFTLSSTGMVRLPITGTPLLTPGQSGILLAGGAAPRPVVEDGAVVAGQVLPLSLTFDHAVVNGVPALRFLEDLGGRVESPFRWLP